MPEKELVNGHSIWFDPEMWMIIGLFLTGYVARTLVSREPFDKRRFFGEAILTVIGAVGFYAAGLLQGMNPLQMIMFGCLGSLGGLRAIEWTIKAVIAIKKASS